MSIVRNVNTNFSNGIPESYTKQMKVSKLFNVSKGQLNKMSLRPNILNEHVESSREGIYTLTSGTPIAGQIYKASQENIDSLLLTIASTGNIEIDTFESYANSAELQAEWVLTGTNQAELETGIVSQGSKSMALPGDALDEWVKTISSTDYTGSQFVFEYYQTAPYSKLHVQFFIGDGTNSKYYDLPISVVDSWGHKHVEEVAMTDDGGTSPDMTVITKIGFRIYSKDPGSHAYIDDFHSHPSAGSLGLKLWDCGTSLPVADGASFDLTNDATQYTEIGDWGIDGAVVSERILDLHGGKKIYHIENFSCGVATEHPNNDILTAGNYYAITLNYIDTDVKIFGPDTTFLTNYYTNGYGFYTSAENIDITTMSGAEGSGDYSDCMFGILSTQPVYFTGYHLHMIDSTGFTSPNGTNASWLTIIEDSNKVFQYLLTSHAGHPVVGGDYHEEFSLRPAYMDKGGKFEVYYNDDHADDIQTIELEVFYLYEPPVTYND